MFGWNLVLSVCVVAIFTATAATLMTRRAFRDCGESLGRWGLSSAVMGGLLGGLLVVAMQQWECQRTPDVVPTPFWADSRVLFQAVLIALLVAATCIDLHCYLIPDFITLTGMTLGLGLAALAGDLQLAHVWVDWNEEVPQIRGPFRPAWLSAHPHLHGLAWSAAGLLAGGLMTWIVRAVASVMLGMEALGFGDVMLMAMIGSFLGWQPTVVAFLLAPLCALSLGIGARVLGNRGYLPYGPFLALGAVIVMFGWRAIWMLEIPLHAEAAAQNRESVFALRRLFGDWLSLVAVAGAALAGFVLLLALRQILQSIPVKRRNGQTSSPESTDVNPEGGTQPSPAHIERSNGD